MKKALVLLSLLALISTPLHAKETWYPAADWKDAPNPLASPYAKPGGTLRYSAFNPPQSFNYYLDTNTFTASVFSLMFETLLGLDPVTSEFCPALAARWSISEDKRVFTFKMDPRAKWSNGEPITALDVKATFDAVRNPDNMTGTFKVSLDPFEEAQVIDDMTIRFVAKEVHWRNLSALSFMYIMPKKLIDSVKFSDINFMFPITSGPYVIEEHKEGISLTMRRRHDYWVFSTPSGKGIYNFDRLYMRFFMDLNNAFEAFKKGETDLYSVYSARIWNLESVGERFEKNWIVKQNIHNYDPMGFQGFAFNMRRPPYDDINVRKALYHLFDRARIVRTLMYGAYQLQFSYYQDLYDEQHPCSNPSYDYSIEIAQQFLAKAGYKINRETGKLEKDGKPLVVRILTREASATTYLALYKNELDKLGIGLEIDQKDFATWMREMDTYNFDVTSAAWGGTLFRDPEYMWSSKTGAAEGGSNLCGFGDPIVDKLILQQRTEFSMTKRNEIARKIDSYLTEYAPYILNWTANSTRILYWNKFGTPKTVLSKFDDEASAIAYWWYDADNDAELKESMQKGTALPSRREEIYFDEQFKAN